MDTDAGDAHGNRQRILSGGEEQDARRQQANQKERGPDVDATWTKAEFDRMGTGGDDDSTNGAVSLPDPCRAAVDGGRMNERFAMCSTFKLPLVAAIMRRADQGKLNLETFVPYTKADMVPHAPVTEAMDCKPSWRDESSKPLRVSLVNLQKLTFQPWVDTPSM